MTNKGKLYLCPTPIGNLEDITLRALKVLEKVDLVAAEDTRVTIKLLNHFEIKTPLMSYHEHNKKTQGAKLVELLLEGKNIALVSDAGTPGLSDPGEDLVRESVKAGIKVVPLPGAAAAICALVSSGLSTKRFVFEGFLPQKARDRKERISELVLESRTVVFYEAPHRIMKTLKDLKEALGNRQIVLAREMTKIHEEFLRGSIEDIIKIFESKRPRGEMVIVMEGAHSKEESHNNSPGKSLSQKELIDELQKNLQEKLDKGLSKKLALRESAEELGISRNEAYKLLINDTL